MNPWRIAEEFRLAFSGAGEFTTTADSLVHTATGAAFVNGQTGGAGTTVTYPQVSFSATVKPLGRSAQVGTADVTMTVESQSEDAEPDATSGQLHDAIVELIRSHYLGDDDATAPAVRAELAARITSRGYLEVDPRITPMSGAPSLDGLRFKTDIVLRCGVFFPV